MTSDLAARLRASAKNWRVDGNDDEADLVSEAADFIESAEASLVKPRDVQRRLAMIESGDYSATEMAYDLERLARHPVWAQAEQAAVDAGEVHRDDSVIITGVVTKLWEWDGIPEADRRKAVAFLLREFGVTDDQ